MCEPLPSSPALPHAGGQAKKGRKRVPGRGNGLGLGKLWQPKSLHGENQTYGFKIRCFEGLEGCAQELRGLPSAGA